MTWHLAQVNVARLVGPIDSPALAGFVANLDQVNAVADRAPGFVWRLQSEDGNATSIQAFTWDVGESAGIIINMSVWTDVEHLAAFVYGDAHRHVLRRRREWFQRMAESHLACWWIPAGHTPSIVEAEARVRHLRAEGPTPFAFTLRTHFPPPGQEDCRVVQESPDDWVCPV